MTSEERVSYRDKLAEAVLVYFGHDRAGRNETSVRMARGIADAVLSVRDAELDRLSQENTHLDLARIELEKWVTQETLRAERAEAELIKTRTDRDEEAQCAVSLRRALEAAHDGVGCTEADAQNLLWQNRASRMLSRVERAREHAARLRSWYHDPEATVTHAGAILRDLEAALGQPPAEKEEDPNGP